MLILKYHRTLLRPEEQGLVRRWFVVSATLAPPLLQQVALPQLVFIFRRLLGFVAMHFEVVC